MSNARPASPFDAIRRTARWGRARHLGGPVSKMERNRLTRHAPSQKRTHTVVPLGRHRVCRIGRPQDLHADVGLIDWAQR
jgi:hypothetical protein